MSDPSDFQRLFDLDQDPAFIVGPDGRVERANAAARSVLGQDPRGADLASFVPGDGTQLALFLDRCSGTRRPLPAAFALKAADGEARRLQWQGVLLSPGTATLPPRLLLRCRRRGVEEFSILGRKIEELNREVGQRRRLQVELVEALAQKDMLVRELQHRVKNHTQMLMGMFREAGRKGESAELERFIETTLTRLHAIGTAESYMYRMLEWQGIDARELIPGLCQAIAASWPEHAAIAVAADDVELRNDQAVPLALILHELLANALRHGLKFGPGRVDVKLQREGPRASLTVEDSGTGATIPEAERAHGGLALIRGLCRQLGGVFSVDRQPHTRCIITWCSGAEAGAV